MVLPPPSIYPAGLPRRRRAGRLFPDLLPGPDGPRRWDVGVLTDVRGRRRAAQRRADQRWAPAAWVLESAAVQRRRGRPERYHGREQRGMWDGGIQCA